MIRKLSDGWALITSNRVYVHDTKEDAERQERAINIAKARRAGHRIPRAPARWRRR